MKLMYIFVGSMIIPLFGSHHVENVTRDLLRKREITRTVIIERLMDIERQINRIQSDITYQDCPHEILIVHTILINDREILSQALNDLSLNGMPLTPTRYL